MTMLKRFLHEDSGQDLVEYALLLALVTLAAASGVGMFGTNVADVWSNLIGSVSGFLTS